MYITLLSYNFDVLLTHMKRILILNEHVQQFETNSHYYLRHFLEVNVRCHIFSEVIHAAINFLNLLEYFKYIFWIVEIVTRDMKYR